MRFRGTFVSKLITPFALLALSGCFTTGILGDVVILTSPSLSVSKAVLPISGTLNVSVAGGVEPFTYSATLGTLVNGVYTAPSTFAGNQTQVTVKVTDLEGQTSSQTFWVYKPGTMDTTFGTGGVLVLNDNAGNWGGIKTDSKNRIYVARGTTQAISILQRLKENGSVDTTFSGDGQAPLAELLPTAVNEALKFLDLHIDEQNRITVAGSVYADGVPKVAAVRFLESGAQDGSYAGGTGHYFATGLRANANTFTDSSGNLYIPGEGTDEIRVTKLTAAGTADPTWGTAGVLTVPIAFGGDCSAGRGFVDHLGYVQLTVHCAVLPTIYSLVVSPSGVPTLAQPGFHAGAGSTHPTTSISATLPSSTTDRISIVTGQFMSNFYYYLFSMDLSATGATPGFSNFPNSVISSLHERPERTLIDSQGRVLICGDITDQANPRLFVHRRSRTNGALDPSFFGDGILAGTDNALLAMNSCTGMTEDSYGRVLVTGNHSSGTDDWITIVRFWN